MFIFVLQAEMHFKAGLLSSLIKKIFKKILKNLIEVYVNYQAFGSKFGLYSEPFCPNDPESTFFLCKKVNFRGAPASLLKRRKISTSIQVAGGGVIPLSPI